MKRKSILIAVFGILFILGGFIANSFIGMNNESKKLKDNADIINKTYKEIENKIDRFNGERKIYNDEIVNNLYIEEVQANYSNWINILSDYKRSMTDIKNYDKFLESYCFEDKYLNSSVESRCNSMLNSYETVINYYVKDIKKFNNIIEMYNENVNDDEKVEKYSLDNVDIIDFNNDGKNMGFDK